MNIFDSLYAWSAIGLLPLNVMLDTVSHLLLEGSSYSGNIDWNNIVKKQARGINNDLGEV